MLSVARMGLAVGALVSGLECHRTVRSMKSRGVWLCVDTALFL